MSQTINLSLPHDYPKRDAEIRKMAEHLAKDSIVTQALERYVTQILTEVHESRIRPLRETNALLLAALKRTLSYLESTEKEFGVSFESADAARDAIAKAEGRS
jgi:hypothetical protein